MKDGFTNQVVSLSLSKLLVVKLSSYRIYTVDMKPWEFTNAVGYSDLITCRRVCSLLISESLWQCFTSRHWQEFVYNLISALLAVPPNPHSFHI